MEILQKEFEKIINELAQKAESESDLEALEAAVNDGFQNMINSTPAKILSSIIKSAKEGGLAERRSIHQGFVERNYSRWKDGFDALEVLVEICSEAGESHARRLGSKELIHDKRFGALMRLHAKGCLVAREICCLLLNGFADGAHGRWRALHELAVTAKFLAECDEETVEKYFLHEYVESYKGSAQHKNYEDRLQAKGVSDEELSRLKEFYDSLIEKYGKNFDNPYGWADKFLNKNRVNFADIERHVQLDHWRPYYKWASQNIHATAMTLSSSLGMVEAKSEGLLAGPSNSGLIDPAHSMAISLVLLTTILLNVEPNIDDLVSIRMITALTDEVGDAFMRCGGLA